MIAFGTVLAKIRKRALEDLSRRGLPREKVLATVVRLLETTNIRVGNDEYAEENDSFGLTTLRNKHVRIEGSTPMFRFRGKSGQGHSVALTDRKLTRIIAQCMDLPGYELFEYLNEEGEVCRIDSADVNAYLREISGQDFTAKDFRTWSGTVLAARELNAAGPAASETAAKKVIVAATKTVAQKLRNRPATCRKYYIHPAIPEAYVIGSLFPVMQRGEEQNAAYSSLGLSPEDYARMVIIANHQIAKAA
jgi:DNA topoisomerase-1